MCIRSLLVLRLKLLPYYPQPGKHSFELKATNWTRPQAANDRSYKEFIIRRAYCLAVIQPW